MLIVIKLIMDILYTETATAAVTVTHRLLDLLLQIDCICTCINKLFVLVVCIIMISDNILRIGDAFWSKFLHNYYDKCNLYLYKQTTF